MQNNNPLHLEIERTLYELSSSIRDLEALSDKLSIDDINEAKRSLEILDDLFFSISSNVGLAQFAMI